MNSQYIRHSCFTVLASLGITSAAMAQEGDTDEEARSVDRGLPSVPADSPSGRFGRNGQKAVSSDAGLSISNTSIDGVDGSTTTLILRPAFDWFLMEDLSLGGFVGVEYNSSPGGDSSVISIGPRLGYNIPVGERLSVWPKVGFSLASTTLSDEGVEGTDIGEDEESNTSIQLNLFAPVMFHPVQHFFIGVGPALDVDLSGDSKATTIAARLTLGGWI